MTVDSLIEEGLRALEEGETKAAVRYFQQAVEKDESAEAWLLLAEAQIVAGSFAKAHKSLSAGLKLETDNIDLLFSLGDLYLEEEKNDKAIATYQQIINLDSEDVDAWVSKAVAQMNDDLEAAEKTCRQALDIDPDSAFAYSALGDIYVAKNSGEDAIKSFLQAIELDSSEPQSYLSLAELYYEADDLDQAEEYCQKGLELDAGLALGYLTLGYIYLDLDRTQEAIDNFQQFLRMEKSAAARNICAEVSAVIDGLK
ncbi:MAG: tetratricopeptide repeat protein [Desulfuromusa sp.]|nr:tetratricopeptide repeat protein [Desulfuromusa sp.]